VRLALDVETRKIIRVQAGSCDRVSSRSLWGSLPGGYRQRTVIYTDDREACQGVLPSQRHRVVSERGGKTSHIEGFDNTLRQRVSRFVREKLAFSRD